MNQNYTFLEKKAFNLMSLPNQIWKYGEAQLGSIQITTSGSSNCFTQSIASNNEFNSPTSNCFSCCSSLLNTSIFNMIKVFNRMEPDTM